LVFLYAGVIWESFTYSFAEYNVIPAIKGGGYSLTFVGFDNFSEILLKVVEGNTEGKTYIEMIFTSFASQIVEIVIIVMFSLFIAVLLNQKMIGRTAFRAIFFIPVVLSTGIMETVNAQSMSESTMGESIDDGSGSSASEGLVSALDFEVLFASMGASGLTGIVTDAVNNIFNIVNRSGVQMLIFLAGLQSISPAIYESCKIDGATAWETFWKITFPMISPMILVNAVYTIIDSFTTESNPVMKYINLVYAADGGNVLSSAMAWIYFLIVILIVAAIAGIMSMFVFYSRKND
jgi:ABC-type sugar transport system permease subunit